MTITYRPLARADFGLLATWLAEPLVARWWHHDPAPAAVERDFGPSVDGREPAEVCIAVLDDQPFGLIQRYRIEHYPEYLEEIARVWPVPAGALSIDYLIGEPRFRGQRLGSRMIANFVELGRPHHRDANDVVVPVSARNRASWRTLECAGFSRVAAGELTPDNPRDPRHHLIYHLPRSAEAAPTTGRYRSQ